MEKICTTPPRKALKHRAKNESRIVPACPQLVAHLLRAHVEQFSTARDGRLFIRADGATRTAPRCASLANPSVVPRSVRVLERALTDADTNQELYAKIMRIQGRLGRHGEIRKTLRLLEVRLNALQDQPDQDLYTLPNNSPRGRWGSAVRNGWRHLHLVSVSRTLAESFPPPSRGVANR